MTEKDLSKRGVCTAGMGCGADAFQIIKVYLSGGERKVIERIDSESILSATGLGRRGRGILGESEVRLDGLVTGEKLLCLFALNGRVNDDLVTLLPVDGGGDAVLVTDLKRVDHTEDLVKVTTGRRGVRDLETDDLLGVNDEDVTDGEWDTLGVDVGRVQGVEHVVLGRNLAVLVTNDGEVDRGLADFVDVLDPGIVRSNVVGGKSDDLDTTLLEFGLLAGNLTELGGADRSEVVRVREEDSPRVTEVLVEVDHTAVNPNRSAKQRSAYSSEKKRRVFQLHRH